MSDSNGIIKFMDAIRVILDSDDDLLNMTHRAIEFEMNRREQEKNTKKLIERMRRLGLIED